MVRLFAALALSTWFVSGLLVAPALLVRRWRAGRRVGREPLLRRRRSGWYVGALALFLAVQVLRVITLVSDPTPVFPDGWLAALDIEAEGILREAPMWLFGLAGVALLMNHFRRRAGVSREPDLEWVIGLYGLGFLFQQLAIVAASGRPW